MKHGLVAMSLALGLGTSACSPTLATAPTLPSKTAPVAERQRVYDDYRLEEEGSPWVGWSFKRKDGEYQLSEIQPLLKSPEAQARIREMKTRAWVVLPMAAVGGALLGMGIGDLIGPEPLFSRSTRTGLFVAGGTLSATSLTLSVVWDPVTGIGGVYNRDLASDLGLPPPPPER